MVHPLSSTNQPPSLRLTDDGLAVEQSILWLDAHHQGDLSFLSGAQGLPRRLMSKILAAEETIAILEGLGRRPNALVCQYQRSFALGQLRFELWPSGHGLGGALLLVEGLGDGGKLLYAPHWRLRRQGSKKNLLRTRLPKADYLVLGAFTPPDFTSSDRDWEIKRLAEDLTSYLSTDKSPIVCVDGFPTAQEVTRFLSKEAGISVAVHPNLAKVHRVYKTYEADLGNFSVGIPRRPRGKVLLVATPPRKTIPRRATHHITTQSRDPEAYFLPMSGSTDDLEDLLKAIEPSQCFYFGPYVNDYLSVHEKLSPSRAQPLFKNNQPPLFSPWSRKDGRQGAPPSLQG